MKITENVSLDIASEASYGCISSGQKFVKNAKSIWIAQKLMENAKIENFKWYILSDFQTMCDVNGFPKNVSKFNEIGVLIHYPTTNCLIKISHYFGGS